jgi:hypothetical protein
MPDGLAILASIFSTVYLDNSILSEVQVGMVQTAKEERIAKLGKFIGVRLMPVWPSPELRWFALNNPPRLSTEDNLTQFHFAQ